jgi:hypothetical protein
LPPRPTATVLRSRPDLDVELKVPTCHRPPESVRVRVGHACACYLEKWGATSLKNAVSGIAQSLSDY